MSLNLTNREIDILKVFWENQKPMTALELSNSSGISINTVQANLKKLLKSKLLKVAEIVYSGTVLTRSYVPTITQEEYINKEFYNNNIPISKFMANFIKSDKIDKETIDELENLINEYKNKE